MTLPSRETITILALDRRQRPVFRMQSINGDLSLDLLDDARAFGLHLLKLEPEVAIVEVYDSAAGEPSSEKPLFIIKRDDPSQTEQAAYQKRQPSASPPGWVRTLVQLILGSSFSG